MVLHHGHLRGQELDSSDEEFGSEEARLADVDDGFSEDDDR